MKNFFVFQTQIISKVFHCTLLFAFACTNWHCAKKLEGFDMIYRSNFPAEIPASASTLLSHNFVFNNISTNATTFYANNAATDGDVIKILPKFARISARFNDADFIFVNRVFVYVYPTGQPERKTEVFYREDVPVNTGNGISLDGGIADVKKIISGDSFTMEVRLDVRGHPSRNIEAMIDFSFLAVTKE
jgi:hypothetical protein